MDGNTVYMRLSEIIDGNLVNAHTLDFVQHEVVDAMACRHTGNESAVGVIDSEAILAGLAYTSVVLVPKGNEVQTEADDVRSYGLILRDVVASRRGNGHLRKIAEQCIGGEISTFGDLALALEKRISNTIYLPLIALIVILIGVLIWYAN